MNSTTNDSTISDTLQPHIIYFLSSGFGLIAVIISMMIVIIVIYSKPRLHTVRHLLICNTCIASIIYCIVQTINYIFLVFLPWITSDVACRWRGYFSYMSISAVIYSYLVQAISRLFFSVFARKYPWITKFKAHYILILTYWIVVIVIPLPSVITKDIYFRPDDLCWVPRQHLIHVVYTMLAYYLIPIFAIIYIYIYIYKRLKKAKKDAAFISNITNDKRDLEVLRNIVTLLGIYIAGALPSLLYIVSAISFLYSAGIVTITLLVMIEKTCTILLDRELRQVVKSIISSKNQIMPFENSVTRQKDQEPVVRFQRT